MFGRSCSGMSNIFLHLVDLIYDRYQHILFLDLNRIASRLDEFCSAILNRGAEIVNVWGFIDGTMRGCCRPSGGSEQRTMYNGHKRKHEIKFQTVVTPDGLISHVFGPIEGRRHDLTLLRKSCLENVIASNPKFRVYIIYGGPAYGRSDQLASPFSGARLTEAQKHVNASMSRVRVSVEWSYGQILQYWPIVDFKKKVKLGSGPASKLYKVTVLLTNCVTCARQRNANSVYFGLKPPTLEEYLDVSSRENVFVI
ncbi:hypothetical protein AaE_009216 [Aphanomyces astaci]|uniref:DDE Tnp4 domain-containing protein n=1 Tax=Aphanomyces astaci TaxID=112090 RepID=A0A6A5A8F5_APHAT|nr:hypothetical protein AaE_009216 [Aphanomyces astaci]